MLNRHDLLTFLIVSFSDSAQISDMILMLQLKLGKYNLKIRVDFNI